jgi:hypothetical protein
MAGLDAMENMFSLPGIELRSYGCPVTEMPTELLCPDDTLLKRSKDGLVSFLTTNINGFPLLRARPLFRKLEQTIRVPACIIRSNIKQNRYGNRYT